MIQKYGGIYGVRDEALLESATETPYQEVFGQTLYPTIFDKAAKYLFDFANYQIFLDGNKRTGLALCVTFLTLNERYLILSPTKQYDLVMDITNHKYDNRLADIAEILKTNSVLEEEYYADKAVEDKEVLLE